jgi:predicted transcriptional regulator
MTRKIQIVLDDQTYGLLEDLAGPRGGNKSFVVREALRRYADREQLERTLDAVLGQRHAREAMNAGIEARQAGRLVPHAAVLKRPRRRQTAR